MLIDRCGVDGASSTKMKPFPPLIANALIAARRGCPSAARHVVRSVLTDNAVADRSDKTPDPTCRDGTSVSCRSCNTTLNRPAMPAAASVWPMLLLADPSATEC